MNGRHYCDNGNSWKDCDRFLVEHWLVIYWLHVAVDCWLWNRDTLVFDEDSGGGWLNVVVADWGSNVSLGGVSNGDLGDGPIRVNPFLVGGFCRRVTQSLLVLLDEAIDVDEIGNSEVDFAVEKILDDLHHDDLVAEESGAAQLGHLLQVLWDPVDVQHAQSFGVVAEGYLLSGLLERIVAKHFDNKLNRRYPIYKDSLLRRLSLFAC